MVAAPVFSVVFARGAMPAAAVSNMMVVMATFVSRVAMVARCVGLLVNNAKLVVAMEIYDFRFVVTVTSDHATTRQEDEGDTVRDSLTRRLVHPVPLHNVKREAPKTDQQNMLLFLR